MHGLTPAGPRWMDRCRGAVRRRFGAWWQTVSGRPRALSAERALHWLTTSAAHDQGLAPVCGTSAVCPGATAAAIPTLWNFGALEQAIAFARSLLSLQARDGSLPDAGLLHASIFNTAQTVRAWRTLIDDDALPEAATGLRKACVYLVSRIAEDGSLHFPAGGGSFERWAPPAVRLSCFAELLTAARRFQMPQWRLALGRIVHRVVRRYDAEFGHAPSHVAAHGVEALLDLAEVDARCEYLARRTLDQSSACLAPDGSLPVDVSHAWVSSAGLAHFAALWCRTGNRPAADAALRCLARRQRADGSWSGSWGRNAAFFPNHGSTWTVKYALDAQRARVTAAFASPTGPLVEPPPVDDSRLKLVERLVEELIAQCGPLARVADVGCGAGRFLHVLAAKHPRLQLVGIDPSPELLRHLPAEAAGMRGDLLRLPNSNASFDAAYCIEALEHALVSQRAVTELCRVVRPGGRVLIIDKDVRFQSLSLTEPWERWFAAESLSAELARHCDDVRCEPLAPGPQQRTPGLFLCWSGVRKSASATTESPQRSAA